MADSNELDRKNLEIIRDFNDAADGLEERTDSSEFLTAAYRLERKFPILMDRARNGMERGELLESMAGVLDHIAKQSFGAKEDSLSSYETVTRIIKRLGDVFVMQLRADTVPEFYNTDQLDYVVGQLKSAAQIRDDMAGYFPNRPSSVPIQEQAQAYRKIAEQVEQISVQHGGGPKIEPPRPRRSDRTIRTRF